MLLLTKCRN